MPVTVGPDDGGRVGRRAEAEAAHFRQQLGRAQRTIGTHRLLDDGEQLALQGPVMPLRALAQALHHLIRGVLDRKIKAFMALIVDMGQIR